jgi:uncharacterized protein
MSTPDMPDAPGSEIRIALQRALRAAMKSRDTVAVSALRSALAAIANAEAVPAPAPAPAAGGRHVAGAVEGVGAAETQRRQLSAAETALLVRDEITQRQAAAAHYRAAGHSDRSERLMREASALEEALPH